MEQITRSARSTRGPASIRILLAIAIFWIGCAANLQADATQPAPLTLTEQERAWLAEHPVIRLAPAPNFPPIEFFDGQGAYQGLAEEITTLIGQRLGVRFELVRFGTWSDVLTGTRNGEADVWAAAARTDEREQYMRFTQPYIRFPAVIITRRDESRTLTIEDLRGKTVVAVDGYATQDYLRKQHPEISLITAPDIGTGMLLVSLGGADAIIASPAPASYFLREKGVANLKLAGETDFTWELAMAARADWPELQPILQKALDSISPDEFAAVKERWFNLAPLTQTSGNTDVFLNVFGVVALGALLATAVVLGWNRALRQQVQRRTTRLEKELEQRRRAEEAHDASEKRLRSFFEAAQEGIFFHNGGTITDVNAGTFEIFGYQYEELVGHSLLEFVVEEERKAVLQRMQAGDPGPYETAVLTREGRRMPVVVRARSLIRDGKTQRVVALQDITDRKIAEMALAEANTVLEDKVEERTRELAEANERLLGLDRLKSMFIATMSHELRTPLNSIIGFTGVILQGLSGEVNPRQKDQLERVYGASKHLLALITDVIDISKIEAGKIEAHAERFNLRELVGIAIEQIEVQARDKGLDIEVDMDTELELDTDRKRYLQCVLNLLSNAVKYTETGRIRISAARENDEISLTVEDTGIGIAKEDMARLFRPFERLDSHLRHVAGGTGLGLYLTRKLAEEVLGGRLGASSEPGRGSRFVLTVAVMPRTAAADTEALAQETSS